jgi:hypothetical protein
MPPAPRHPARSRARPQADRRRDRIHATPHEGGRSVRATTAS